MGAEERGLAEDRSRGTFPAKKAFPTQIKPQEYVLVGGHGSGYAVPLSLPVRFSQAAPQSSHFIEELNQLIFLISLVDRENLYSCHLLCTPEEEEEPWGKLEPRVLLDSGAGGWGLGRG